jgi:hypothetical protein
MTVLMIVTTLRMKRTRRMTRRMDLPSKRRSTTESTTTTTTTRTLTRMMSLPEPTLKMLPLTPTSVPPSKSDPTVTL